LIKVYRYEHPSDTFGPYHYQNWLKDDIDEELEFMALEHSDDDHPPMAREDALEQLGYDPLDDDVDAIEFKYGCVTLEDLDRWFDGYHNLLYEAGFVLAEYDVPEEDVTEPDQFGQVMFVSSC